MTEGLQIVDRKVVAKFVGECVLQNAAVTVAQNEAVAVAPVGVGRVVTHDASPQRDPQWRQRHGGAAMARVGGRRSVHGHGGDFANRLTFYFGGAGKEFVGHGYESSESAHALGRRTQG
jgi:hypothetical protein